MSDSTGREAPCNGAEPHEQKAKPAGPGPAANDTFTRPPFKPNYHPILTTSTERLVGINKRSVAASGGKDPQWEVALSHDVHFSVNHFFSALKDIALHPERNSSLILRADPLPPRSSSAPTNPGEPSDNDTASNKSNIGPSLDVEAIALGMERVEELRRRLMPRQPKRDGKLDQRIAFYRTSSLEDESTGHSDGREGSERTPISADSAMVLMIPEVKDVEDLPYYHPPVQKLAILYESLDIGPNITGVPSDSEGSELELRGSITIAFQRFTPLARNEALQNGMSALNLKTEAQGKGEHEDDKAISDSPETKVHPLVKENLGKPPMVVDNPMLSSLRRTPPRRRSPLATSSTISVATEEVNVEQSEGISKVTPSGASSGSQLSPQVKESVTASENRLQRTSLHILERVYKFGYSGLTGYRKRVHHDVVVKRESFQDLYLALKERHHHLESRAPKTGSTKVEDLKRHVWKSGCHSPSDPELPTSDLSHWGSQDIAIATFLMLLWKDMYPPRSITEPKENEAEPRQWDTWGRPTGGFIDLGCGNGLLVHVLISEGYIGKGYELRARRTWPLYPPATRAALVELPIDFPTWFPNTIEEWESNSWQGRDDCPIKQNSFIIGNHADEITPWIPLLSLIPAEPVPSLSLPCCFHTLDGNFTKTAYKPPSHPHAPQGGYSDELDGSSGRYNSYLKWLGWCGLQCGWEWEKESLRIPSTKSWAIVSRRRWTKTSVELQQCRRWALREVEEVRDRGQFKVRMKGGNRSLELWVSPIPPTDTFDLKGAQIMPERLKSGATTLRH